MFARILREREEVDAFGAERHVGDVDGELWGRGVVGDRRRVPKLMRWVSQIPPKNKNVFFYPP